MENVPNPGPITNCYFPIHSIGLQNVVLWAEIAYNQHLPWSDFSLVLKVLEELGELLLNTGKRRKSFLKIKKIIKKSF